MTNIQNSIDDFRGQRSWPELLMEFCIAIYAATLLMKFGGEIRGFVMWTAFALWLFGVEKPYLNSLFKDRIFILSLSFIMLSGISTLWSPSPFETLTAWQHDFDDYLAIIPPIVHLSTLPGAIKRFLRIFSCAGITTILANLGHYIYEYFSGLHTIVNMHLTHYSWALPLVLYAPFLLASAQNSAGWKRAFWIAAFITSGLMLLPTGARGAWLAFLVATFLYQALSFDHKKIAITLVLVGLASTVIYFSLPKDSIVIEKIHQGFDTSGRVNGTWKPAITMGLEHPILGKGFGKPIYFQTYDVNKPLHPEWTVIGARAPTPHNFYLLTFFSLGAIGLALIVALIFSITRRYYRYFSTFRDGPDAGYYAALIAAFISYYVIRGTFETLTWGPMGLFLGVAVGLSFLPLSDTHITQPWTKVTPE